MVSCCSASGHGTCCRLTATASSAQGRKHNMPSKFPTSHLCTGSDREGRSQTYSAYAADQSISKLRMLTCGNIASAQIVGFRLALRVTRASRHLHQELIYPLKSLRGERRPYLVHQIAIDITRISDKRALGALALNEPFATVLHELHFATLPPPTVDI